MPHEDWVLNAEQAASREYSKRQAHKQLREGFIFLVLDAIYRLDLIAARRLFETGSEFLEEEEQWSHRNTTAAIKPLLHTVEQLVAQGVLVLEKPLPYIRSQAALEQLRQVTRCNHGSVQSYRNDQSWEVEQIIRTDRGLFEIQLRLEPRGGFDPPTWYVETYLYRFRVTVRDWQLQPVVDEKHITFEACIGAIQSFLKKNPAVEEGPKTPPATSDGR